MQTGLTRWIKRWNAFWFPETTAVRLCICRIVVAAAQLFLFFPSLEGNVLKYLHPGWEFVDPQFLILAISALVPYDMFPSPPVLTGIYWGTAVAGVFTLIGLWTRTSAFLFALGNWILIAHKYSYGEIHHPEAILCIFLMMLAFSPSGQRFSLDALISRFRMQKQNGRQPIPDRVATAMWPLKLAQVLLTLSYLENGVSKLAYGGFAWMNGYTMQNMLLADAVKWERPIGVWLAQQHTLCILLSIGTILFELLFVVVLIAPRTIPYFLLGGALLHTGIYVTMAAPFFQFIVMYVVFVDFDRLLARERVWNAEGREELSRREAPAKRVEASSTA